ncbi:MAG TPA: hypothetical protein VGM17_02465 [Rhizomicrobium sp.]
MKPQTRWGSLAEAAQNVLVGYAISVVATYTIGPFFHMRPGVGDVLGFGLVMTAISIARSYGVRRWNEYKRGKHTPPDFQHVIEEIAAERNRQISGEGYTLAHDDAHERGEIGAGAAAYAFAASLQLSFPRLLGPNAKAWHDDAAHGSAVGLVQQAWPWPRHQFKPGTARRNLVKAGAMIVAEIGRVDRAAKCGGRR